MWQTIKPYLVGAAAAIAAVIAFIVGRRRDSQADIERVRDTVGDHDERTRIRGGLADRIEDADQSATDVNTDAEILKQRLDDAIDSTRHTITDNRRFIERVRREQKERHNDSND